MCGRMTTETAEQPRHEDDDDEQLLRADTEQTTTHAQLDDANSATDSDADDSAPEPDDQDAALQQAHSEVRISVSLLGHLQVAVLLATFVILK